MQQMNSALVALFGGMFVFVLGLILAGVVIDTGETIGSKANIGSFTGVRSVNDLAPLIFDGALMLVGLGLMIGGGLGLAGRGPMAGGGGFRRRR